MALPAGEVDERPVVERDGGNVVADRLVGTGDDAVHRAADLLEDVLHVWRVGADVVVDGRVGGSHSGRIHDRRRFIATRSTPPCPTDVSRPEPAEIGAGQDPSLPYEVHLIWIPDRDALNSYMEDPRRHALLAAFGDVFTSKQAVEVELLGETSLI